MHATPLILIVDDDPSIRRLGKRILKSFAIETLEAATGQEALKHVETSGNLLTALLTDMNLPDMQGDALSDWTRNQQPHLPVIFFSGSPLRESARLRLNEPNTFCLSKPFTKDAVSDILEKILSAAKT